MFLAGCTTSDSFSDSTVSPAEIPSKTFRESSSPDRSNGFFRADLSAFLALEWPVKGPILSRFGDPKGDIVNKGIDIQASFGSPVRAAQEGHVSFVSERLKGFGRIIVLDHRDGFQTVYAHNSENLVRSGEFVKAKRVIARLGSSGRAATPYLHFEVRRNYRPVDPLKYLAEAP